jgi:hypothetical protein
VLLSEFQLSPVDVDLVMVKGELAAADSELLTVLPMPTGSGCERPEQYGREGRREDLCREGRRERIFGRTGSRISPREPGFGWGNDDFGAFRDYDQISKCGETSGPAIET